MKEFYCSGRSAYTRGVPLPRAGFSALAACRSRTNRGLRAQEANLPKHESSKLTDDDVQREVSSLAGWELREGKLYREFRFENFIKAFGFLAQLAIVAEKLNHHPEWRIVYNRVSMSLHTRDVGGISKLDVELARAANHYFEGIVG